MNFISDLTYDKLCSTLINGKYIHFTSDCELFTNFDVVCKVIQIKIAKNNEFLIVGKRKNGKEITIGSNMHNLSYEFL